MVRFHFLTDVNKHFGKKKLWIFDRIPSRDGDGVRDITGERTSAFDSVEDELTISLFTREWDRIIGGKQGTVDFWYRDGPSSNVIADRDFFLRILYLQLKITNSLYKQLRE